MDPVALRRAAVWIKRKLKRGKAFEANKMHGLLAVSLEANEPFCSDPRCCEDCLSRELTGTDAQGREFKKTQYYHKQVYAPISGPELSVILDWEPMRPGEEECAAALRLLRRMRPQYGARFFDVVVVVARLWVKIIAFTLFRAFAVLHGKLVRLGKATLNEVRQQIYRSLPCSTPMPFFSG